MTEVTWKTKDGRVIPVHMMQIDHMHRCVYMVARSRLVSRKLIRDAMKACAYASTAPDGAADAASGAATELFAAAHDVNQIKVRLDYAIEASKAIAAMVERLKRAKVDVLTAPSVGMCTYEALPQTVQLPGVKRKPKRIGKR